MTTGSSSSRGTVESLTSVVTSSGGFRGTFVMSTFMKQRTSAVPFVAIYTSSSFLVLSSVVSLGRQIYRRSVSILASFFSFYLLSRRRGGGGRVEGGGGLELSCVCFFVGCHLGRASVCLVG